MSSETGRPTLNRLISAIILFSAQAFGQAPPRWEPAGPAGGSMGQVHVQGPYRFAVTWAGLFRSGNGRGWSLIAPGFVPSAFIASGDALLAMAATGPDRADGDAWLSSDQGATWKRLGSAAASFGGIHVEHLFWHGRYLFAAGDPSSLGISRSADSGRTWQWSYDTATGASRNGMTTNGPYCLGALGPDLFAGTSDGIFRSADSGGAWTPAGVTDKYVGGMLRIGSYLVAATSAGIFRTRNGTVWTHHSAPINPQAWNPVRMAVAGTGLYAALDTAVYRSGDSGATWERVRGTGDYITSLAAAGDTLYAGTQDRGLFLSADGGATWANAGVQGANINSLSATPAGLFASPWENGQLFRSTDRGLSWKESGFEPVRNTAPPMAAAALGRFLLVGQGNGVFRSADDGATWQQTAKQLGGVRAFLVQGDTLYAGSTVPGIFRSTDSGKAWDQVGPLVAPVTCFAKSGTALFAGGSSSGGLYRSLDGGSSWRDVTPAGMHPNIAEMAVNDQGLFVLSMSSYGSPLGVMRTRDQGETWTALDAKLAATGLAASGSDLFAIVDSGGAVSVSRDGGDTWSPAGEGLPAGSINCLAWQEGYLFAGLDGASVWRLPFPDPITTALSRPRAGAGGFRLVGRNGDRATFAFTIRRRGWVELAAYESRGRKTATLFRALLDAGDHLVACDAPMPPGGIRFLRLSADGTARSITLPTRR